MIVKYQHFYAKPYNKYPVLEYQFKTKCREERSIQILKDKTATSDAKISRFFMMSNIPLIFDGDGLALPSKNAKKIIKIPM